MSSLSWVNQGSASPNSEVFMAALLYKNFLIIVTGQFDKEKNCAYPLPM